MARRFRGFLPVVIDVETGGFHSATDALLEIAAVLIDMQPDGTLKRGATHSFHVRPFEGARLDPAALAITGIDPFHPLRPALPERDALGRVFREIRHAIHAHNCRRAILVGHNAAFDLGFLNAAVARAEVKRNPFHPFSCFDTATLGGRGAGSDCPGEGPCGCGPAMGSRAALTPRPTTPSGPQMCSASSATGSTTVSAMRRTAHAQWAGSMQRRRSKRRPMSRRWRRDFTPRPLPPGTTASSARHCDTSRGLYRIRRRARR